MTWTGEPTPKDPALGLVGWLRFCLRAVAMVLASVFLVVLLVLAYMVELPFRGSNPFSTQIIRFWGRVGRILSGLKLEVIGQEMPHGGALVANHSTWLDIFVLHEAAHIHFVSKAEVASWPGIGFLARISKTIFIERDRAQAKQQQADLAARIAKGDRLCFFPEGTSSDALRVLPFKTALFSVFHTEKLRPLTWVQPVSVAYFPAKDRPNSFYGWWGDMPYGANLLKIFGISVGGRVVVTYHDPLKADAYADRKSLAKDAHSKVIEGLKASLGERYVE